MLYYIILHDIILTCIIYAGVCGGVFACACMYARMHLFFIRATSSMRRMGRLAKSTLIKVQVRCQHSKSAGIPKAGGILRRKLGLFVETSFPSAMLLLVGMPVR